MILSYHQIVFSLYRKSKSDWDHALPFRRSHDLSPIYKNPFLVFPCQVFDHFSCDDQSNYGRNEGCGTWNITTLGAFMCCARRTDTVCTTADGHILDRTDRFLLRIYHFELLDPTFFEFTAHNFCQRADGCFVNVCYLKSSRVELVSGSHTADDRNRLLWLP